LNENKLEEDLQISLKLFVVLSKAIKILLEHTGKDIKNYNLSGTEFAVLELLYHKGKITLSEVGDKILITSGGITYNIDKLEKKGYLYRTPSTEDRRVVNAVITEKGVNLFDSIFENHVKAIHESMHGLTNEEKKVAIELIKKLGKYAQKVIK
jgi:MarR family transcriptional regulator, 2-MHQ and catechol-resistance regulon repressor